MGYQRTREASTAGMRLPSPWGGVILKEQTASVVCSCRSRCSVYNTVHAAGCPFVGAMVNSLARTDKPAPIRILLPSGNPWTRKRRAPKRKRGDRSASSPYKFLLQFFFERPVNIDLWKRIRAPRGWRKCPTSENKQHQYYGVRFQCRDLKYALTPDEVQELQAR